MTLGTLRRITEGMPDETRLVIKFTQVGDITSAIDDISVNRAVLPVAYLETGITETDF